MSVAFPGDPAFEAATQVFNLSAPAQPVAALTAHTIDEIRAAIRYADSEGLQVRVHTTGHASAARRPVSDAVLIRTELDGGVEVDAAARVARMPAGTKWGAVVEAATPHGLTGPHGSSGRVGVVGYLLGGGMSFYGRKVGLGVNSIRAIELVTADGELRRVDASSDPELFWALRGGGGGFGVVTAIEIELFPAANVITGAAYWPAEHAERLMSIWRQWTLDAPWEATTSVRIMNLPPLDVVPEPLRGRTTVSIDGAFLSQTEDLTDVTRQAEELLGPLRAVAEPVLDSWQLTTPAAVLQAHMDPEDPVPFVGEHMLLSEIGADGQAEFLRVAGPGSGSPFIVAGLRQLGGAFAVPNPAGGALTHLDARYSYAGSGVPAGPPTAEDLRSHSAKVRAALSPWETGRTVPSFVEDFDQPQGHLGADALERVDRVRARVDPHGRFADDIARNATANR